MSEAQVGQVICHAGRGVRCGHKRVATFFDGGVKGQICSIGADAQMCSYGGFEVDVLGKKKPKTVVIP